jgi:metal-sulfur cluster biosynthetic enzyme
MKGASQVADPAETPDTATSSSTETTATGVNSNRPNEEQLWEVLRQIEDPELRLGIVELGLIYCVNMDDDGLVTIDMTLTSPACPVGPMLQGQAYHLLTEMDGVEDVEVNLVWEPPWDPKTMASEEVRMQLGIW